MDRKVGKGFTLIELLVVIALISILLTMGIPTYTAWKAKYDLEEDIKDVYSLINEARIRSFTEKRVCGVVWGTSPFNTLYLKCDTDDNGDINDSGSELIKIKKLKQEFKRTTRLSKVKFSKGVLTNSGVGLTIYPASFVSGEENCVVISLVRVRLGKWNGSRCEY